MTFTEVLNLAEKRLNNRPFVLFAAPGQKEITVLFPEENDTASSAGFVLQSFTSDKRLFFPGSLIFKAQIELLNLDGSTTLTSPEGDEFRRLVSETVEFIKQGNADKIVVSRCETVYFQKALRLVFEQLCSQFPQTFRYWLYHPDAGCWMGATPERLISVEDNHFSIMSLAGTQRTDENRSWTTKEIREQGIVTDYILRAMAPFAYNLTCSEPTTHQAGNVSHIRTDIEGQLKEGMLQHIIDALHPTPAVCGLPREEAYKFIRENEGYDRLFYSGFLGWIDSKKGKADLFVNLRCMKITGREAKIYVGCGITADSIPDDEFQETVNKAHAMKSILL